MMTRIKGLQKIIIVPHEPALPSGDDLEAGAGHGRGGLRQIDNQEFQVGDVLKILGVGR